MAKDIFSAHTALQDSSTAASALITDLQGMQPVAVVFFASHLHDGALISREIKRAFPEAAVIGCTTAGELTQHVSTTGSVSLLALGAGKVRRAAAALARFDASVPAGVQDATNALAERLDVNLREADPQRFVGITLVEGLRMNEEAANEALGNAAPLLSFVGGSAGDNLEFKVTRVFCDGEESDNGAALLLMDAAVPFVVGKTCSFAPHSAAVKVTRADVAQRVVYELGGKPILDVYAEALGKQGSEINADVFMTHPLGLMIDGLPWIRSPQQVLPDGGIKFYCRLREDAEVHVMRSTDLVQDTHDEIKRVRAALSGKLSGGFAFNCILRRLELDATRQHGRFLEAFTGLEVGGFHTYGESWLGHINQTFTGLWFA